MTTKKVADWAQLSGEDSSEDEAKVEQPEKDQPPAVHPQSKPQQQGEEKQYRKERPRRERRDPKQIKAEQLKKLESIKGNEIWLYVYRKEKFDPKEIEQKIELLRPIKVFNSANGWDIKVTREKAQEILGGDRKFPFYEIGNKNFPRDRERDNYRGKKEDEDYEHFDREYKYEGGDSDYRSDNRSYKRGGRYIQKGDSRYEPREPRPSDGTGEEGDKPVASEFEFKKNKGSKSDKPDYKPERQRREKRERNEFGTGIGAFRNNPKVTELPKQEEHLPEPSNLVEVTKQSSKIEQVHDNDRFANLQLTKKGVSQQPKKMKYKLKDQPTKKEEKKSPRKSSNSGEKETKDQVPEPAKIGQSSKQDSSPSPQPKQGKKNNTYNGNNRFNMLPS